MLTNAIACRRLAALDPAAGYAAVFGGWQPRYTFGVRWLRGAPETGPSPSACFLDRSVAVYPFTVGDPDERIAEAAHEVAHLLNGKCHGRPPHRRNPLVLGVECVRCEVQATDRAIALVQEAGLRWTHTMHERLARGLRSYRRVPAMPGQLFELNVLVNSGYYKARLDFVMKERR
jgi:hypothetical protein